MPNRHEPIPTVLPDKAPIDASEATDDMWAAPASWGDWDMSLLTDEEREAEQERMSAWMEETSPGYTRGDGILVWVGGARLHPLPEGAQALLDEISDIQSRPAYEVHRSAPARFGNAVLVKLGIRNKDRIGSDGIHESWNDLDLVEASDRITAIRQAENVPDLST
jgi:hypothetical protein